MDRETLGDQVVQYGGAKILLVEEGLADALSDATIDAESDDGLIINRTGNGHEGEPR